jgi:hypothetical protein
MLRQRQPRPSGGKVKQWNPIFQTHRYFYDQERPHHQRQDSEEGDLSWDSNFIKFLLRVDEEDDTPLGRSEELWDYCRDSVPTNIRQHSAENSNFPKTARAWLSDTEESTGYTREYRNRLTAAQIRTALQQPVCHNSLPAGDVYM